jgi:hypothetical protein
MGFFSNLWSGLKSGVSNLYNRAKEGISNVWTQHIKPIVNRIPLVGNMISNTAEHAGRALDTGVQAVGNIAEGKIKDFAKNALRFGADYVGSKIPGIGGTVATYLKENVPNLRKGGVVAPPVVGGTRPYVMHDGKPVNVFQR